MHCSSSSFHWWDEFLARTTAAAWLLLLLVLICWMTDCLASSLFLANSSIFFLWISSNFLRSSVPFLMMKLRFSFFSLKTRSKCTNDCRVIAFNHHHLIISSLSCLVPMKGEEPEDEVVPLSPPLTNPPPPPPEVVSAVRRLLISPSAKTWNNHWTLLGLT